MKYYVRGNTSRCNTFARAAFPQNTVLYRKARIVNRYIGIGVAGCGRPLDTKAQLCHARFAGRRSMPQLRSIHFWIANRVSLASQSHIFNPIKALQTSRLAFFC